MTDLSKTIAPKSDQLNADDLIAGPMTIKITKVSASPSSPEQPVSIHFEGDNGKPYKPCKSMRRVLVFAWTADGSSYAGRKMTLFREPSVKFGGIEVGGIRISHMSHIDSDLTMALTETRAKRSPYKVRKLEEKTERSAKPSSPVPRERIDNAVEWLSARGISQPEAEEHVGRQADEWTKEDLRKVMEFGNAFGTAPRETGDGDA